MSPLLRKTAAHWGEQAGVAAIGMGRNWFEVPAVQRRINQLVSGDPAIGMYEWFAKRILATGQSLPLERSLTLGCGSGELERGLHRIGFARQFEGVDIASQAVNMAIAALEGLDSADIRYTVSDINRICLPEHAYDVIFCPMSAHHFSELERIFKQVHQALKPGGLFVLNEYIGPNRFQWPPHQTAIIHALLSSLPERWIKTSDGGLRRSYRPPTAEEVVAVDPSEAVRSADILHLLSAEFAITTIKGYGGNLLDGFFDHIGMNFVEECEETESMLATLFAIEDWGLRHQVFAHDFALIIAQRPADVQASPGFYVPGWPDNLHSIYTQFDASQQAVRWLESVVQDQGKSLMARESDIDTWRKQHDASQEAIDWLKSQILQRESEQAALKSEMQALRQTLSWRITAPLRALRRLI